MITTTYNYSGASGFTFDSSKIQFASGHAELKSASIPGQTLSTDFSAPGFDFTDPALIQVFAGTQIEQIQQIPSHATFFAALSQTINAQWGGPSGSSIGGGSISGGALLGNSTAAKGALWNTPVSAIGAVRFTVIPQYTGAPSGTVHFYVQRTAPNAIFNSIVVYHHSSGSLFVQFYGNGGLLINISDVFSPVSGTPYEIEVDYDFTHNIQCLYVNGTRIANGTVGGARDPCTQHVLGSNINDTQGGNSNYQNLILFDAVQHSGMSYTPGDPPSYTIYDYAGCLAPILTTVTTPTSWDSFTTTDTNNAHYVLNELYWDGSAWSATDFSYGQTNDVATINAHLDALPLTTTLSIATLFPDQDVQGTCSAQVMSYSITGYSTTNPTIAPNAPLTLDQLTVFTAVAAATGSDGVQFYLLIGSVKYYWSGSAWVVSDGSYAQTNDAATIATHAATLPISLGVFFTPYALLHSTAGLTTPTLTSLTLTYEYFGPEPGGPNFCEIFGYIIDEKGIPVANATVTVTNPTTFINQGLVQAQCAIGTSTNALGYFAINLAETATVNAYLTFSVTYPAGQGRPSPIPIGYSFGRTRVPNAPSANISTLVFT